MVLIHVNVDDGVHSVVGSRKISVAKQVSRA